MKGLLFFMKSFHLYSTNYQHKFHRFMTFWSNTKQIHQRFSYATTKLSYYLELKTMMSLEKFTNSLFYVFEPLFRWN